MEIYRIGGIPLTPQEHYHKVALQLESLDPVELSQMFGKPCLKTNGKAFASFFQEEMVFKLSGTEHREALLLSGSKLFDPSGKNRPMKEWVQVSFEHHNQWLALAQAALKYIEAKSK